MNFDMIDIFGISHLIEYGKEKLGFCPEKEQAQEKTVYIPKKIMPTKFSFRPKNLDEYISQEKAKEKVRLTMEIINKKKPCHFLFFGNSGHGKTTLAGIVAHELGLKFNMFIGSNFSIEDINYFIDKNNTGEQVQIMFIDEIHAVNIEVLEYLLPIIEDFQLNNNPIRPFLLMGASTERFLLTKKCNPFVDRINCVVQLEEYNENDIKEILHQYNNQIYQEIVSDEEYTLLARNTRFCPRIALSYFDLFMACKSVNKVLHINRIIKDGLNDVDIKIMEHLNMTNGKPIGEETLSIVANTDRTEYKQIIEPYLIRRGLISRTNRGRILTSKGLLFLQGIKND